MINRLPNGYAVTPEGATPAGAVPPPPATARGLSGRFLSKAAESIGTHPVATLGIAFGAGLLLGKLVKR